MKHPQMPPDKSLVFKKAITGLLDLLMDQDLNKKLQDINNDYPYWDKFKYQTAGFKYDSALLWSYNRMIRDRSVSKIKINDVPGFEFKFSTTNNILECLHKFDMNMGGILEGRPIIPKEDKNRYLVSSIMEEAIASSQLEGAATTREIAKQMLRSNRKPRTVDEKMIVNNYLTIKHVLEIKDREFSKKSILQLHSIVSKDIFKDKVNEGKFRITNDVNVVDNITGDIFYTPPKFEDLESLMSSFCDFANHTETEFVHPIIKGIILHFLIGYIHPFVDGNGRTARAIFYWYLISKGYWLVEYMSISKIILKAPAQYAKAYLHTEYDDNDLTYFIQYNLRSMDLALNNLQEYIQRKVMEKQDMFHLIQNEDVNERQAELLRNLITDDKKGLTIKEVQIKFDVAYQTARTDLIGLQLLGYLKEKKSGKKLIYFRVEEFEKKVESVLKSKI